MVEILGIQYETTRREELNLIDSNEEFLFYDIERKECSIVIIETTGIFKYKSLDNYTYDEHILCFETLRQRA